MSDANSINTEDFEEKFNETVQNIYNDEFAQMEYDFRSGNMPSNHRKNDSSHFFEKDDSMISDAATLQKYKQMANNFGNEGKFHLNQFSNEDESYKSEKTMRDIQRFERELKNIIIKRDFEEERLESIRNDIKMETKRLKEVESESKNLQIERTNDHYTQLNLSFQQKKEETEKLVNEIESHRAVILEEKAKNKNLEKELIDTQNDMAKVTINLKETENSLMLLSSKCNIKDCEIKDLEQKMTKIKENVQKERDLFNQTISSLETNIKVLHQRKIQDEVMKGENLRLNEEMVKNMKEEIAALKMKDVENAMRIKNFGMELKEKDERNKMSVSYYENEIWKIKIESCNGWEQMRKGCQDWRERVEEEWRKEMEVMKRRLREVEEEKEKRSVEMGNEIGRLLKKCAELEEEKERREKELREKNEIRETKVNREIEEMRKKCSGLEEEKEQFEKVYNKLEEEKETNENELKGEIEELKIRLRDLEEGKEDVTKIKKRLKEEMGNKQKILKLKQKNSDLEKVIGAKDDEIVKAVRAAREDVIKDMSRDLSAANSNIDRLNADHNSAVNSLLDSLRRQEAEIVLLRKNLKEAKIRGSPVIENFIEEINNECRRIETTVKSDMGGVALDYGDKIETVAQNVKILAGRIEAMQKFKPNKREFGTKNVDVIHKLCFVGLNLTNLLRFWEKNVGTFCRVLKEVELELYNLETTYGGVGGYFKRMRTPRNVAEVVGLLGKLRDVLSDRAKIKEF